ncbi:hypothetical protein Nepgr_004166 [Nepenthes gracilis]|uniref:Fungal lipase-type domain-containing protein n=1 Tax=Nepenthes gracilis TaxID=150966 RepID=A0AAD3S0V1_NEPGR|nr:hypothetical protein Nepgr_004166 [Nepenthes gracilis]
MVGLCLRTGLVGISSSVFGTDSAEVPPNRSQFSAVGRPPATPNSVSVEKADKTAQLNFSFRYPLLRSLFPGGKQRSKGEVGLDDADLVESKERQGTAGGGGGNGEEGGNILGQSEGDDLNSVLKILHVKSLWSLKQGKGKIGDDEGQELEEREKDEEENAGSDDQKIELPSSRDDSEDAGVCRACYDDDDDDENEVVFDRDSFSKMLKKVSLTEAKLYAQMSYLGNLAYSIPKIKPGNLLKCHGLRYVTSSIDKREQFALDSTKKKEPLVDTETEISSTAPKDTEKRPEGMLKLESQKSEGYQISASAAFQIAASASSYLLTRTRSILPFRQSNDDVGKVMAEGGRERDEVAAGISEMASFMATTDSVTSVIAAREEVKQGVANDLNSISSSPCEWYICDDSQSVTRFFVIQGSESLASWQANLLFEPIQFEGLDVLVHRGIYEAAKGIYQQMLPEVHAHMKSCGSRGKFRFTGHSLGGSISLLINLMLLIRGEVPPSLMLPVIAFGSPCIMYGGDVLLSKLGLPRSHVRVITMHRDIVPRAFSCRYPSHVAEFLKAVNGNFRNHPCLNNQKLLFAPTGDLLILQPDANFSPQHDLLPPGSGLYVLSCTMADAEETEKKLQVAKNVFLNTPHPLQILSDRSAYGNGGTIQRDHDMTSYLKCLHFVIHQELKRVRKAKRELRRKVWWPLMVPHAVDAGAIVRSCSSGLSTADRSHFLSETVRTGSESLKRFSRLVASHHVHLLFVLIGTFAMIGDR